MVHSQTQPENRCIAQTRQGRRCRNKAQEGSDYCYVHRREDEHTIPVEEEIPSEELQEQLLQELENLLRRVRELFPDYTPEGYWPTRVADKLDEKTAGLPPGIRRGILKPLRRLISQDLLDIETWKGFWYMANYTAGYQKDLLKRRLKGDYETDAWGLDWEFIEVLRPFLDFLYKVYWRVETTGIEQLPDYERVVLVSNHAGQIPWDGVMILMALLEEHPAQRTVRVLYNDWYARLPLFSSLLAKIGQVPASLEDGIALLDNDEVVCLFPEGDLGMGKPITSRYRMAHFDNSDFIRMAVRTGSPIVPVSVVGAEETHISLIRAAGVGRLAGLPYIPVSLRFPWLGPLGAIPLPSKWYIDFGQPLFDEYAPGIDQKPEVMSRMADSTRSKIQAMVDDRLAQRRSVFL